MAETEQPESEPNMIGPQTDTSAPTKRPATLAEFLERYPLPWRPYRIDSISGAEWEIEAANGKLVPNHGGLHYVREWAEVFAEMGNEVGRLRGLVEAAYREGCRDGFSDGAASENHGLYKSENESWSGSDARRALADTSAPAAQQEGE